MVGDILVGGRRLAWWTTTLPVGSPAGELLAVELGATRYEYEVSLRPIRLAALLLHMGPIERPEDTATTHFARCRHAWGGDPNSLLPIFDPGKPPCLDLS